MKKLLLGTVAIVALACGSANAADLPVAPYYKAPPAPCCSWGGWYMGFNGGWIGTSDNNLQLTGTDTGTGGIGRPLGLPPGVVNLDNGSSGWLAGGQLGHNWQFGWAVFGIEADFDAASASHAHVIDTRTPGFVPVRYTTNSELNDLATVRARFGATFGSALVYATGGYALGMNNLELAAICPTCGPALPSTTVANGQQTGVNSSLNRNSGWVAGAGFEWCFAPHWSVKAEYLHVDLGSHNTTITYNYGANASTLTASTNDRYDIVRVGLNWQFSSWFGPVVAAY